VTEPLSMELTTRHGGGDESRPAAPRPEPLIGQSTTLEAPSERVVITRHAFDWGEGVEPDEATGARIQALGDRLALGVWFLNLRFTVSSRTVSAEFFRAARHARSQWLKQVRGSISLQRETRSVVARARRSSMMYALGLGAEGLHANLSLSSLSAEERLDVLQDGRIAKQLTFSGLMFIDGDHILPRTWNAMADELLGPEPPAKKSAHRHPTTRSTSEAPRN